MRVAAIVVAWCVGRGAVERRLTVPTKRYQERRKRDRREEKNGGEGNGTTRCR